MVTILRRTLLSLLPLPGLLLAADSADVVIYGGTSGGITAAIQTARMGKTAILIEPTKFLGGLTTGGLGATDIGNKKAIGGLSREFYASVFRYYSDGAMWQHETRDAYFAKKPHGNTGSEDTMWTFEPHAATEIYDAMLKAVADKVTVVFGERLDLKNGVVKDGPKITYVLLPSNIENQALNTIVYQRITLSMLGVNVNYIGFHLAMDSCKNGQK